MNLLYKNTLKKISKAKGRFLSLVLIVLVGVGFYSGIQITAPDILKVANTYYEQSNLYDLRVVSTMGFSDNNITELSKHELIDSVVPSYVADGVSSDKIIRVHALSDSVNKIQLQSGRMPKNDNEAIGDPKTFSIGDKVNLDEYDETLKTASFTITGLAESALYIGESYGPTHRGNGKLNSYLFVPQSAFDTSIISEVSIILKDAPILVKENRYDESVKTVEKYIQSISKVQTQEHLNDLRFEARVEVDAKQLELNNEKIKAQSEIDQARTRLTQSQNDLNKALKTIHSQQQSLNEMSASKREELTINQRNLDSKRFEIENNLSSLGIQQQDLPDVIKALDSQILSLQESLNGLEPSDPKYTQISEEIGFQKVRLEGLITLESSIATINQSQVQISEGLKTLEQETSLAQDEINDALFEIQTNQNTITKAFRTLNANQETLNKETLEAQKLLDEAYAEIEAIEMPKWHTFVRSSSGAYLELDSSVKVISSIAKVFPIFFVLIALLMTSNSMSRMINEERTELGTLSSLGFSDRNIIQTYCVYALIVSVIGVLTGFFIGIYGIPPLIYTTFSNFRLPKLIYIIDYRVLLIALLLTLTLMIFVSIQVSHKELRSNPASLLRPLPPKQGKKTILQNIPFIWDRLSFNWKVTLRNIFRYKKRAIMTIVGVAGCTALLLVGFGLRDSMTGIERIQYSEIFKYQSMITLHDTQSNSSEDLDKALPEFGIDNYASLQQIPFKLVSENNPLDIYLLAFDLNQDYSPYFELESSINSNPVEINKGISITEKLADILNIGIGDTISIENRDYETFDLKVDNIVKNYISHYIYIDSNTFQSQFNQDLNVNTIVTETSFDNDTETVERMIEDKFAINVMTSNEMSSSIRDTNKSLDGIVLLIVGVAALLAFVVLYNLTSINISERKRELATLKVLGFSDSEANGYIYREALVLTVMSIVLGLLAGAILHRYVVEVIEGTGMMFFKTIQLNSYLFSALITIAISLLMQIITFQVIKRINMVEALKTNE